MEKRIVELESEIERQDVLIKHILSLQGQVDHSEKSPNKPQPEDVDQLQAGAANRRPQAAAKDTNGNGADADSQGANTDFGLLGAPGSGGDGADASAQAGAGKLGRWLARSRP